MILIKDGVKNKLLLSISILICSIGVKGQFNTDTSFYKNTIKVNLTNPAIFGINCFAFGYERVVSSSQSFSANIGRFNLPKFEFVNTDSIGLDSKYNDNGFNFAIDYRFYLKKENKYRAPRGIYIGPYYTFNSFYRKNKWSLNTSEFIGDVNTEINLMTNLFGAQMGYQFIFKERISLDFVFLGPGIWLYKVKTKIGTTLDLKDESLLFEKINELLESKLPGHDILLEPGDYENKGSFNASSGGLRYVVQLGFRF